VIAEYKKKTNIGVGVGFILQLVGRVMLNGAGNAGGAGALLATLLVLAGAVFFIWGCMSYAKGKGYAAGWGLLGLLSILGLIILALFPDKHKDG